MELKYKSNTMSTNDRVLIVPLWNWNHVYCTGWRIAACSNCTFMELKSSNYIVRRTAWCSNCTFMELKLPRGILPSMKSVVLIVPLWNWNLGGGVDSLPAEEVLIVPLWNWNSRYTQTASEKMSSNCTFMELKYR